MLRNTLKEWKLWAMASLTLGLAPFFPEPHLFGKIRWILGGAEGMQAADWFDFAMHGAPWVMLILSIIVNLRSRSLAA